MIFAPNPRVLLAFRDLILVELIANMINAPRSVEPMALRAGAALQTRRRFFTARQCTCLRAYRSV
jgi:hypothetical protein